MGAVGAADVGRGRQDRLTLPMALNISVEAAGGGVGQSWGMDRTLGIGGGGCHRKKQDRFG